MNPDIDLALQLLPLQLWNTIYMVAVAAFFAVLIGLPVGVILTITDKGHIKEHVGLYKVLETVVNIGRSFPFAILMVALIPFTRWLVGTSLGTTAAIVPLTVAAAPFVARLIEASLKEVDHHILEAAIIMGSNTWQIITKVLLQEALPSILSGITLTIVNLIGYSAMAGLIGGGGLGQVAIQYGYNRFNTFIMVTTVILLILLVQGVQWVGNRVVKSILKKRGKLIYE
ncbi:methionine ABC transporter permease [Estrella lausannensis]|uniref:ABC transporter permease n=1 Tax=Estrella lausannensis TaxID=483423 RepID=A0A0H5DTV4_9BACT|nr:methionine ABC transporter permease [Estrella lausannensis]CRX39319.1 ABC transporter permease [Estrella lausannensis]